MRFIINPTRVKRCFEDCIVPVADVSLLGLVPHIRGHLGTLFETRCEYVPVSSAPASLPVRVSNKVHSESQKSFLDSRGPVAPARENKCPLLAPIHLLT